MSSRPACALLVSVFVASAGCGRAVSPEPEADASTDAARLDGGMLQDVSAQGDASPDATPTGCAEDCHALDDVCHVAHCNESAGLCVIENRDGSCDDGDPCTEADQCLVGACVGFPITGCCMPDCTGAMCGDDGCGGTCGTCGPGLLCDATRRCVTGAIAGDTCATATEITALPFRVTSSTTPLSDDYALPWGACARGGLPGTNGFGEAAPDAVFRFHPTQDGVLLVTLSTSGFAGGLYATTDCAALRYACLGALTPIALPTLGPVPIDVRAGVDVFLIVDGDGDVDGDFTLSVDGCTPDCSGAECGTNGCLEPCESQCPREIEWNCSTARTCVCEGSCTDRECGSDGCTGTCGTCGPGRSCDAHGHCVATGLPGDTAASAIPITTPTFRYDGDTTGYGNDAFLWGSCRANPGTSSFYGDATPDVMFSLAPPALTTYYVDVIGTGFSATLYSLADAADPYSCLEGAYLPATLREQLLVEASAADPVLLVVDGQSAGAGPFTLRAQACHTAADCPDASPGQFCSWPHVVGSLPFDVTDFRGALNAYETPVGACGITHTLGVDGIDSVYAYTATRSGNVTATVQGLGQMDPILVVTTDCASIATSCVAVADATGADGAETVTFAATAGVTYFVIVDSFGPLGGQIHLTLR